MLSVSGRTLSGFWILCLTAFLFSMKASAATYVVAKQNCSDTAAGTAAQPWCTIGHAAAKMVPGDTVTIGPGSYNESVSPKSGTAVAFITYQGQPGAVLNGTGLNAQAFNIDNVAYLNISGFEVTQYLQPRPAGNSVDIYGTSHDIHFSKMLVHDNWNGIIMSDSANNIYISSSTVYNSRYGVGF